MVGESRLLLLRHAETAAPDRLHGSESDIPLGERGFRQARAVGDLLKAERPDALYCSNLTRARQTAEAIGHVCGLSPQVVPDLRERNMGDLSGAPRVTALRDYFAETAHWNTGAFDHARPGGESFAQVRDRAVPALERIADANRGRTAVVVLHGIVLRVLFVSLLPDFAPADFDEIAIDFTAINDLRRDDQGWRLVSLNRRFAGWPEPEPTPVLMPEETPP